MAKYPVTNCEFLEFLKDTRFPEILLPGSLEFFHPLRQTIRSTQSAVRLPMLIVIGFQKRQDAFFSLLSLNGNSLPGPQKNEFPWGNEFNPEVTNTLESGLQSTPVGLFQWVLLLWCHGYGRKCGGVCIK